MSTPETASQYADELVGRAQQAAAAFREFDQASVDRIVRAVYEAAYAARMQLARLALEETGMGVYEHKVVKNAWASLLVYDDIRHARTVGEITWTTCAESRRSPSRKARFWPRFPSRTRPRRPSSRRSSA